MLLSLLTRVLMGGANSIYGEDGKRVFCFLRLRLLLGFSLYDSLVVGRQTLA